MGIILVLVLALLFVGSLPRWGYNRGWGSRPSQFLGLLIVAVLACMLMGYIPRGF